MDSMASKFGREDRKLLVNCGKLLSGFTFTAKDFKMNIKSIWIGCDHAGFPHKDRIKGARSRQMGIAVKHYGTRSRWIRWIIPILCTR